jgi:hypothetical protein
MKKKLKMKKKKFIKTKNNKTIMPIKGYAGDKNSSSLVLSVLSPTL